MACWSDGCPPCQAGGPGPGAVQRVGAFLQHPDPGLLPVGLHPAAALFPPAVHAAHGPGACAPAWCLPPTVGPQVCPPPLQLAPSLSLGLQGAGVPAQCPFSAPVQGTLAEKGGTEASGFGWKDQGRAEASAAPVRHHGLSLLGFGDRAAAGLHPTWSWLEWEGAMEPTPGDGVESDALGPTVGRMWSVGPRCCRRRRTG